MLDRWITRPRSAPKWVDVASGMQQFYRYLMNNAVYGTGWDGDVITTVDSAGNFDIAIGNGPDT